MTVEEFCKKYDIERDELEEDIIEAIEEGENVVVCENCKKPLLEEETTICDTCGKALCNSCFGDPISETECKNCLDSFK